MTKPQKANIAIVGATGMVGKELLSLFEKDDSSNNNNYKIFLFASDKSKGKIIQFKNKNLVVDTLDKDSFKNIDIAFFAMGGGNSKKYLPFAQLYKTIVIDLSSAFRMNENVPLVIPEINPHALKNRPKLIASPNCTTTIMLMPLHKLHKKYTIKRIVASTYQAASGGGYKLTNKLINDTKNALKSSEIDKDSYGFNLFLHDSPHNDQKYSAEEIKMHKETIKILEDPSIKTTATCVRVPTLRAHSISLNVEFEKEASLKEIYNILEKDPNIEIIEDTKKASFATPLHATNNHKIFVSRIRKDLTQKNSIEMWVTGDQILKGAALNAYQIYKHYSTF